MSEKVDLSLDDIIKMNKRQTRGAGPKGNSQKLKHLGSRSGLVRKTGPRQATRQSNNNNNQQQANSQKREATLLHVSNLHYDVSNDDVRELFREIGPIKKAAVHYDKSGRSLGTAEVVFLNRDAALRAIKKYHNLPLDGRPMSITLVPSGNQPQLRSPAKSRIGVKQGSGIFKKSQTNTKPVGTQVKNRAGTVRTKPRFQRQKKQPSMTAEQLDADLEAYTMKTS